MNVKIPTVALDCLGCKLNQAEIQQFSRHLEAAGYKLAAPEDKADIYILNTCSVTQVADSKSRHLLRLAHRRNPKARLIAIGCYAQRAPEELSKIEGVELVLGNDRKMDLLKLLGEVKTLAPLPPAPQQAGRTRSFVKMQDGCRNFCAYCIVPYVRSKEHCVPPDEVVALVSDLTEKGYREIVLTGTEIGSYQAGDVNLVGLIRRILAETPVPRIRLSSLQPHQISPELVNLWENERLCPHFHISLQSGSDAVLKRMNRRYTAEGYREAVKLIRAKAPDAAITTDVIVGFPRETDNEFKATVIFCREVKFARVHVFPFSPRPGTAAAIMPGQVTATVKKERAAQMLLLSKESAAAFREGFIGKTIDVLFEQQSGGVWSGLTGNYIKAYVKSNENLTNRIVPVKLVKLYRDGLWVEF